MITYSVGSAFGEGMDGSGSNADADMPSIFGAILFVNTWIYDVVHAPLAVHKRNQKLLGKRSANLKFEFDRRCDSIKVTLIRAF